MPYVSVNGIRLAYERTGNYQVPALTEVPCPCTGEAALTRGAVTLRLVARGEGANWQDTIDVVLCAEAADLIPECDYAELGSRGHPGFPERQDEVNSAMIEFIDKY